MAATRLVIAHRLSTIIDADRLVVMDKGSVEQEGTFTELMDQPEGLFFRLASRQLRRRAEVPARQTSDRSGTTRPPGVPFVALPRDFASWLPLVRAPPRRY